MTRGLWKKGEHRNGLFAGGTWHSRDLFDRRQSEHPCESGSQTGFGRLAEYTDPFHLEVRLLVEPD